MSIHGLLRLDPLRGVGASSGEKGCLALRSRAGLSAGGGACRVCAQYADTSMHECVSRSLQICSAALRVALIPRLALAIVALPAPGSTVASGWSRRPRACSISSIGRRRLLVASNDATAALPFLTAASTSAARVWSSWLRPCVCSTWLRLCRLQTPRRTSMAQVCHE